MPPPPPPRSPSDSELLDALPFGVIAVTPEGAIVRSNAPARALVAGLGTPAIRVCGDLFACQAAGGPCARSCFVARVAGSTRPAPEIRIDTPGGVAPGALWVAAAPLADGRGVVLHVRPGRRGDRRRRSEERWQAGPELRIRALGRTRVEALQDSLDSSWLSQRPGLVLKYLVCERKRVVLVDEIAESVWPDSGPKSVSNTRYAIHRLRTKLEPRREPHDPPSFVVSVGSGYALDRQRIWIDADEFEQAVDEGRAAMMRLDAEGANAHLERAMDLYGGPFLADEPYAHWAVDERNRLAGMAAYALRVLTALARERHDGAAAVGHLERLADLEPLDNGVHRELVQALIGEGLSSDAKRRYDSFAGRLRLQLDQEPDFTLRSLARPPGR